MSQGTSKQVERNFVTSATSGTYSDNIIIFMQWLFDTRSQFLVQYYIPEFKAMNHKDLLVFKRREEDEILTNRINRNPINEITGIQKLRRQIVDQIYPSQSGISHNSTIKIDGEVAITYEVV